MAVFRRGVQARATRRMKILQLLCSLTFWLGLPGFLFLLWLWNGSMLHGTRLGSDR